MAKSKCVRCGQCCIWVGRTFWLNGDFQDWPELEELAEKTKSIDEGLPCEMLQMTDGIATCKIELLYGRAAKPKVCRGYSVLSCHQQTSDIPKGRTVCYLQSG